MAERGGKRAGWCSSLAAAPTSYPPSGAGRPSPVCLSCLLHFSLSQDFAFSFLPLEPTLTLLPADLATHLCPSSHLCLPALSSLFPLPVQLVFGLCLPFCFPSRFPPASLPRPLNADSITKYLWCGLRKIRKPVFSNNNSYYLRAKADSQS